MTDITSPLLDKIKEHGIQRVVVDSTAVFEMYYKEPAEVRKQLFKLLAGLKEIGTTSLLTSELPEESSTLAKFGVEEFIVDTVIILHFLGIGEENYNSLQIRKMRRTNHKKDVFPMEITDKGIVVKQIQY
jgi:circadian clock protein KaiC